jgi:hypothetical protein
MYYLRSIFVELVFPFLTSQIQRRVERYSKEIAMRWILPFILMLPASTVCAQGNPGIAEAPGCGVMSQNFSVKTDKHQHPFAKADAGNALLYFVEDDSDFNASPKPTVRLGIDGMWAGATHGSSYFYVPVTPGEHHICASWQGKYMEQYAQAAHFTAEAGHIYCFVAKDTFSSPKGGDLVRKIDLNRVNSDEGQLLASQYPFSTSHAK